MRGFMRAYWGINDDSHRILKRKKKVDKDIKGLLQNKFGVPFITYVWGKDNYKHLTKHGLNCVKVSDNPYQWDLIEFQYRHKLEALKLAMLDGLDEMVHLDWDNIPIKTMDDEFWKILGSKAEMQANLIWYKNRNAPGRKTDRNLIPNGGFMYCRNVALVQGLIDVWEARPNRSMEPALATFLDQLGGGWQGKDHYFKLFEPVVSRTRKRWIFPNEEYEGKQYFKHYILG